MSASSLTPAHSPEEHSPQTRHASKDGSVKGSKGPRFVVLTGNPNCGKTTIFNALTGLRAKVGNYSGVTVERKEGRLLGAPSEWQARVLDLPGTYSLNPQSLDEKISRDVLLNRLPEVPSAALVVVVVDASNLQRHLYYATQVIELGYPTLIALNMVDVAQQNGQCIDSVALSEALGVPILPVIGSTGKGVRELRQAILSTLQSPKAQEARSFITLPEPLAREVRNVSDALLRLSPNHPIQARAEAFLLLADDHAADSEATSVPSELARIAAESRRRLEAEGVDWRSGAIESRYKTIARIQESVTIQTSPPGETLSDRLDRVLTHKVWGTLIFLALMGLMFQCIFTLASLPMELLEHGVDWLGGAVRASIPPGDLNSLLVDGVVAGVGAVVVFLPQILLLFLFIGFLEDTGYMARAAFIMDRLMSKVGLHGKSFIPMISSFACAIPGIMATRTIESPKDRLVTILIAPLMSCSARLPVYTLLISACIPDTRVLGFIRLPGLTMLSMYLLGITAALAMAWIFKKTLLRGEPPLLILELPPYKRPIATLVLRHMWDRAAIFLKQAGTVILCINIVLWFLASYPKHPELAHQHATRGDTPSGANAPPTQPRDPGNATRIHDTEITLSPEDAGLRLEHSFAGRLGHAIEPAIAPLGFDWKIGIGIVTSFAAREVFVSTMSTVYSVAGGDAKIEGLAQTLKEQKRPDGRPLYTPLTGLTLMVFYVFALQCVSTVAIVRRETNSWRWPLFQWLYLGILAWSGAFLTWHIGLLLGFH